MTDYKSITETNNFIVLDKYTKIIQQEAGYQTESDLEKELIQDLKNQGYEYLSNLNNTEEMLKNIRVQLETLNNINFLDSEWKRFCEEYLDKPSDNYIDRTRKIHDDYIYDFVFDDGHIQNIYLLDKKNMSRNKL
ncbi:MAG: type I restriction endonuclease, partial [Cetobacterium sp.]